MEWFVEEAVYNPNDEEYNQVLSDQIQGWITSANIDYLNGDIDRRDISTRFHSRYGFSVIREETQLTTEDEYQWSIGIKTVDEKIKEALPIVEHQGMVVLFPNKEENGRNFENVSCYRENLENSDDLLEVEKIQQEKNNELISLLADDSKPVLDRSISIYTTPKTTEEYISQKLSDISKILDQN